MADFNALGKQDHEVLAGIASIPAGQQDQTAVSYIRKAHALGDRVQNFLRSVRIAEQCVFGIGTDVFKGFFGHNKHYVRMYDPAGFGGQGAAC